MRAMQQWLDRFCYKHPRLGIPGLMRYIVIGNVLVYLLNLFSTNGYPVASALLSFDTSAILQGQVELALRAQGLEQLGQSVFSDLFQAYPLPFSASLGSLSVVW